MAHSVARFIVDWVKLLCHNGDQCITGDASEDSTPRLPVHNFRLLNCLDRKVKGQNREQMTEVQPGYVTIFYPKRNFIFVLD